MCRGATLAAALRFFTYLLEEREKTDLLVSDICIEVLNIGPGSHVVGYTLLNF